MHSVICYGGRVWDHDFGQHPIGVRLSTKIYGENASESNAASSEAGRGLTVIPPKPSAARNVAFTAEAAFAPADVSRLRTAKSHHLAAFLPGRLSPAGLRSLAGESLAGRSGLRRARGGPVRSALYSERDRSGAVPCCVRPENSPPSAVVSSAVAQGWAFRFHAIILRARRFDDRERRSWLLI